MKKILFISAGGTIASQQTESGLAPQMKGQLLLDYVPEIGDICSVDCVELLNIDSSNMQPHHWSELAQKIIAEYENYNGFVISHGTDTMAYTSSALGFMLKGISKPVAITGAQLPIEHPKTDGKENLINAFRVAAGDHPAVWLVFADKVIKGDCAKKLYTKNPRAFESVNEPVAALIADGKITWQTSECEDMSVFAPKTAVDKRVFVYKLIPGASEKVLDFAVQSGYRAIVTEGFGAGGVPNAENSLLPALERAINAGVIVVCASQCIYDGVHLDIYDIGVKAERLGAMSAKEMTVEAVVTKLMWALGNSKTNEQAKEMFLK